MIDPKARALLAATKPRVQLKIHEIKPEDIEPNGDRYCIEAIDFDETIELGSLLVITQPVPQKDEYGREIPDSHPQADPTIERRGVIAGIIITAGNGHLLGLPDPGVAVTKQGPHGAPMGDLLTRVPADVPMFFKPGDVVLIDHNAKGRALKIVGREYRIVGQIDILARVNGIRVRRNDDGDWERIE